jgi:molybdopterin-guanine dinucleotide biosynthesis protein A
VSGVVGLLLAGGQSRRMGGGDKCLRVLAGRTLLARAIERIAPQVDELILNANGDAQRFSDAGLPVVGDVVDGFAGPLAGVLTGMCWVRENRPAVRWLATFPTDAPFLPTDLVARLLDAVAERGLPLACAMSAGRTHPPVALWDVGLADDLRTAMIDEGLRKIDVWTARHGIAHVDWPAEPFDPFFNANRPEDLAEAGRLIVLSR